MNLGSRVVSAIAVVLLSLAATTRYCQLVVRGEVRPVFATWLLFGTAVLIGLGTYLTDRRRERSVITNIGNTVDAGATWVILLCVILFGQGIRQAPTKAEWACLVAAATVAVYWAIRRDSHTANVAVNGILTVGYIPMFVHLWSTPTNTESFGMWGINWMISAAALWNPIRERDGLAILYNARAFVLVTLTLGLILRLELRVAL